jgi:hypothetical protein
MWSLLQPHEPDRFALAHPAIEPVVARESPLARQRGIVLQRPRPQVVGGYQEPRFVVGTGDSLPRATMLPHAAACAMAWLRFAGSKPHRSQKALFNPRRNACSGVNLDLVPWSEGSVLVADMPALQSSSFVCVGTRLARSARKLKALAGEPGEAAQDQGAALDRSGRGEGRGGASLTDRGPRLVGSRTRRSPGAEQRASDEHLVAS